MTKFELKQIIKGLIMESINESKSKNFVSSKKTKKLKEQNETEPFDPQASAEPDAGEMEGPESQDLDADPMLAQIDTIVGILYSLRAKLSGDPEPGEEPEGEEVSDENEMGEEDLEDGSEESEQV
jgi:hypothetical protein